VREDVDNCTPTMAFSPNGKVLCVASTTTISGRDGGGKERRSVLGTLQVYVVPKDARSKPSRPIHTMPLMEDGGTGVADKKNPVAGLVWHVRLNQLLVATAGGFRIFYSADWSKKGILLAAGRRRSKRGGDDALQELYASRAPPPGAAIREENIITPNALPLFGGDQHRKNRKRKMQQDDGGVDEDTARRIPQKPPSRGVYDTHNTMFTQMIMDTEGSAQKQIAGRDPREALAMYSEGKSYIGKAYEGNIERILTDKTVEQEEEEMKKKGRK
jgi:hypothetical protein